MTPAIRSDVTIVGAGVIGLSVAWKAAIAGHRVTLVDSRPGRGATWAAAGMLAPAGEAHFGEEPLARLNVAGADRWPAFAHDLTAEQGGKPTGFMRSGTVIVAADRSDRAVIDDLLHFQRSLGLAAVPFSGHDARELEPLLAPGVQGGASFPGDHQVDNRALVRALLIGCHNHDVTLVSDTVRRVDIVAGRVKEVTLAGGATLAGDAVVVAAGCHSGSIDGLVGPVRPPVRPVAGVTIRLRVPADRPRIGCIVRGLVHGNHCYVVPRADGTVVVGATTDERGFDTVVRAGAVYQLMRDARTLLPVIDEYEVIESVAGLRPGSPDNAPLVGPTSVSGLIIATGHYRHGVLLAPVTADAVVALLAGRPVIDEFAPFAPDRFGTSIALTA